MYLFRPASRVPVIWYSGIQVSVSCYKNRPPVVEASSSSRNSLVLCTEMTTFIKTDTLTSFVALAVRKKSSEIWRTNSWFPLHDSAPAHRSVLFKLFLAKNSVTTLEHPPPPPYSWSGSSWFSPVPSTSVGIKGSALLWCNWHNQECDGRAEKDFTNGSQKCFQHLYIHWQKYIVAQGDGFEGNVI
jgi:hypothetical protein